MPKRKREKWTTRQAAEHCGLTPATFRNYTLPDRPLRNQAPQPIPDLFGPRGERYFWADEVRTWKASRRGLAWRRDTPKET